MSNQKNSKPKNNNPDNSNVKRIDEKDISQQVDDILVLGVQPVNNKKQDKAELKAPAKPNQNMLSSNNNTRSTFQTQRDKEVDNIFTEPDKATSTSVTESVIAKTSEPTSAPDPALLTVPPTKKRVGPRSNYYKYPSIKDSLIDKLQSGELTTAEASKALGISPHTFYKYKSRAMVESGLQLMTKEEKIYLSKKDNKGTDN